MAKAKSSRNSSRLCVKLLSMSKTPYVTLLPPLKCSLSNYPDHNQWEPLFGHHRPPPNDQSELSSSFGEKSPEPHEPSVPLRLHRHTQPTTFHGLVKHSNPFENGKMRQKCSLWLIKNMYSTICWSNFQSHCCQPNKKNLLFLKFESILICGKTNARNKNDKKKFFSGKIPEFFFLEKKNFIINVKFCIRTYVMKTRKLSKSTSKKT
mgnify:CR=1 FL=1